MSGPRMLLFGEGGREGCWLAKGRCKMARLLGLVEVYVIQISLLATKGV